MTFYTSVGITKHNLNTLDTTKFFLVFLLDALLTDIIARLVIVIVLNVARRYLSKVAKQMGGNWHIILAHATPLNIESGESEHLLLKSAELLIGYLPEEKLLGKTTVTRVLRPVLDVVHTLDEKLLSNIERTAELCCIKTSFRLVHDDHNIVGRLIVNKQLAITVGNVST